MLFYFCLTALAASKIFKTKNNREEQTERNNANRPCGCLFFIVRICTHLLSLSLLRRVYYTYQYSTNFLYTHNYVTSQGCGMYL